MTAMPDPARLARRSVLLTMRRTGLPYDLARGKVMTAIAVTIHRLELDGHVSNGWLVAMINTLIEQEDTTPMDQQNTPAGTPDGPLTARLAAKDMPQAAQEVRDTLAAMHSALGPFVRALARWDEARDRAAGFYQDTCGPNGARGAALTGQLDAVLHILYTHAQTGQDRYPGAIAGADTEVAYVTGLARQEQAGVWSPLKVGPYSLFTLIGALQLVLRHPNMQGATREILTQLIADLRVPFERTMGEDLIDKGFNPDYDVDPAEVGQ